MSRPKAGNAKGRRRTRNKTKENMPKHEPRLSQGNTGNGPSTHTKNEDKDTPRLRPGPANDMPRIPEGTRGSKRTGQGHAKELSRVCPGAAGLQGQAMDTPRTSQRHAKAETVKDTDYKNRPRTGQEQAKDVPRASHDVKDPRSKDIARPGQEHHAKNRPKQSTPRTGQENTKEHRYPYQKPSMRQERAENARMTYTDTPTNKPRTRERAAKGMLKTCKEHNKKRAKVMPRTGPPRGRRKVIPRIRHGQAKDAPRTGQVCTNARYAMDMHGQAIYTSQSGGYVQAFVAKDTTGTGRQHAKNKPKAWQEHAKYKPGTRRGQVQDVPKP